MSPKSRKVEFLKKLLFYRVRIHTSLFSLIKSSAKFKLFKTIKVWIDSVKKSLMSDLMFNKFFSKKAQRRT